MSGIYNPTTPYTDAMAVSAMGAKGAGNPLNHDIPASAVGSGTYTGNGGTNTATPHGLGVVPKFILYSCYDQPNSAASQGWISEGGECIQLSTGTFETVTAPDATNFYVSSGKANINLYNYKWIAWG